MKMSFGKSALALAVMIAVSSMAGQSAHADMKAKHDGKGTQEHCESRKHHDGYGKGAHEQWKKTLTPEQKAEAARLRAALEKEMVPLKAKVDLKKAEIKGLLAADAPDKAALGKLINEVGELEKAAMKAKYEHRISVRALLTAEQKALFDTALLTGDGHQHGQRHH